jgi:membrane protease YdiL (CAAX protease family)
MSKTKMTKMTKIVFNCVIFAFSTILLIIPVNHYDISPKSKIIISNYLIIRICLLTPLLEEFVFRYILIEIIKLFTTNTKMYWISHLLFALAHIKIPNTSYNYLNNTNVYFIFGIFYIIRITQLLYFGKLCTELLNKYGFIFAFMCHSLYNTTFVIIDLFIQ